MVIKRSKSDVLQIPDISGVDTSGGGGGFHIPEGDYEMVVNSVKKGTSSNDNEQFEWTFKGTEGKAKGKIFYLYTSLVDKALWKLRQTLEALEVEIPDSAFEVPIEDLIGLETVGTVIDDTYQGKLRSKLDRLVNGGSEPTPRKKAAAKKVVKLSEEEVGGMNENELEGVITKYGLEIDLSDFKTPRKKIAAVVVALRDEGALEE